MEKGLYHFAKCYVFGQNDQCILFQPDSTILTDFKTPTLNISRKSTSKDHKIYYQKVNKLDSDPDLKCLMLCFSTEHSRRSFQKTLCTEIQTFVRTSECNPQLSVVLKQSEITKYLSQLKVHRQQINAVLVCAIDPDLSAMKNFLFVDNTFEIVFCETIPEFDLYFMQRQLRSSQLRVLELRRDFLIWQRNVKRNRRG